MNKEEFKAEQSKLGLNNAEMAALLHVSVRAVERWRQGSRGVPGPVVAFFEEKRRRDNVSTRN